MKRNFIKAVSLTMAAALAAVGIAGCGGSTASESDKSDDAKAVEESAAEPEEEETTEEAAIAESVDTVKVGVLLPLSGATSYYGGVQLDGIQFCVDYVNNNGGIKSLGGAKIELDIQDSASSPETGISAFEQLVGDGVTAIIGPYNSTVAAATAPLSIQYQVPYVIVNATAENFLTSPNKYLYRTNTGSGDGDLIYALAIEYLNEVRPDNPTDKVAIVYDSGDWGTAANNTWNDTAEAMGYEVVVSEAVSESSTDLSTLVNKIKEADTDLVILAAFSAATNLFCKQMSDYQCPAAIMGLGGGTGDLEFISNCGSASENVMMLSSWLPKYGGCSDEAQALADAFTEEKGYEMTMEGCWGWLGMATIVNAIEAAGSADREAVADALYDLDVDGDDWSCYFVDFEGVKFCTEGEQSDKFETGTRYNNNIKSGERDGVVLVQVQDGKWSVVYPADSGNAINY